MKSHNSTYGEQDNLIANIHNIMESLRMEMMGGKGVMTKCPVCLDKVGLVVDVERRLQTVKCRRCKNIVKIKTDNFGADWTMKSPMGVQKVGDF